MSKKHSDQVFIWWTTVNDYQSIPDEGMLDYIQKEVNSRQGRSGRGRLWVPKEIEFDDIQWLNQHPICKYIELVNAGGIVIWKKDVKQIIDLPGFVTDSDFNYIAPEN